MGALFSEKYALCLRYSLHLKSNNISVKDFTQTESGSMLLLRDYGCWEWNYSSYPIDKSVQLTCKLKKKKKPLVSYPHTNRRHQFSGCLSSFTLKVSCIPQIGFCSSSRGLSATGSVSDTFCNDTSESMLPATTVLLKETMSIIHDQGSEISFSNVATATDNHVHQNLFTAYILPWLRLELNYY